MSQRKDKPTALISGAGGLIGRHLAQHLHSKGWRVFAVARRALDYTCHAEQLIHVKADLGDKAQLVEALKGAGASGAGGITHVFHCALQQSVEDPVKACEVNLVMLRWSGVGFGSGEVRRGFEGGHRSLGGPPQGGSEHPAPCSSGCQMQRVAARERNKK